MKSLMSICNTGVIKIDYIYFIENNTMNEFTYPSRPAGLSKRLISWESADSFLSRNSNFRDEWFSIEAAKAFLAISVYLIEIRNHTFTWKICSSVFHFKNPCEEILPHAAQYEAEDIKWIEPKYLQHHWKITYKNSSW